MTLSGKRVLPLLLPLFLTITQSALAAPQAELWDFWQDSVESNSSEIDHSAWQKILFEHIYKDESGLNLFDYQSAKSEASLDLAEYLSDMARVDPRNYSAAEQKAYWINHYNALTVQLILKNYPIESIGNLGRGFFKFGPWDDEIVIVAGEPLTLNDIEHRILRPIWQDARIHFAVNCASIGCPNLQPIAYTATNTEGLLELSAFEYLSHARGALFDSRGRLQLSSIFDWYAEDFGASENEVLITLSSYAPNELAEQLRAYEGKIDYDYDWQLNDRIEGI